MNQAMLAFKNMLRAAKHDPVWALVALIAAPFRAIKPVIVGFFLVSLVVSLDGGAILEAIGLGKSTLAMGALSILALMVVLVFRLLTNPLFMHFGDLEGATHGSARFATNREGGAFIRSDTGYLIDRDANPALYAPTVFSNSVRCNRVGLH